MDLRERLLGLMGRNPQLLHVARARDVQHATNPPSSATSDATVTQQPALPPREDRATADATTAQSRREARATAVQQPAPDRDAALQVWSDEEIALFERRKARVIWLGYPAADHVAECLLHRDRDLDDRRLCVECRHARPGWRCEVREAFMLDRLQRCPRFVAQPGVVA